LEKEGTLKGPSYFRTMVGMTRGRADRKGVWDEGKEEVGLRRNGGRKEKKLAGKRRRNSACGRQKSTKKTQQDLT